CTLAERTQLAGERRIIKRPKAVEKRFEHDRCGKAKRQHEQGRSWRGGRRPGSRQCPGECDESENGDRGQNRRNREAFRPVEPPAPRRLGREAPAALADVPSPERKRQPKQRQDSEHEDREQKGTFPPGKTFDKGVEPRSRASEYKQRQDHQPERRIDEKRDVERPVVAPSALELLGREQQAR